VLTNTASDRVKRLRRLAKRAARHQSGLVLVEGPQACAEAAQAGLVLELYVMSDAVRSAQGTIDATLAAAGQVHEASAQYVRSISDDAQGCLAVARDPWAGIDRGEGLPGLEPGGSASLVAVFEEIRDPGNTGTAIRAADAAGADLIWLTDQSVDPTSPKVIRASAGSYFHLPVVRAGSVEGIVSRLRAGGLRILAADAAGAEPLREARLDQPTAWLFGNEARGLSVAARTASDNVVRIEIYGRAESLNLAMAATLCLYASAEAWRQAS
jgi:TrmH family RNA methyltransferase